MKTGVTAVKLAIGAFIIPYVFVYNPILVMVDVNLPELAMALAFALLGMMAISSALIGYFIRPSSLLERAMLLAAGLTMVMPGMISSGSGLALIAVSYLLQRQRPALTAAA
ncbi:DUF3394 domain-containing protein [Zobellella aerophila]|uniref:Uncharacterized protein n=1 Tax=Zobellella aerophila TaxID=870480 RepID=A0ABP6V830_9GAMM